MRQRSWCLALVFAFSWAAIAFASRPPAPLSREPLLGLPLELGSWHGRSAPPLDKRTLAILGADDHVNRVYVDGAGTMVSLYVGYHASQKHGDSIHSPMNCLPGSGWIPVQSDRVRLGESVSVANRVIIEKDGNRQLVLYWYQGRGRTIADEYVSKAYLFLDALRTGRTDAALVRIVNAIDPARGVPAAERVATRFAADLAPFLPRHLPE
jgi:EpsI family protein